MQEYETIRSARAMLQVSRASVPSERIVAGYLARTALIMRRAGPGADIDGLIAQAKQTRSASSWFSRRAALAYSFRLSIEKMLGEQDAIQRALKAANVSDDSSSWDKWRSLVRKMGRMLEWHARLQGELGPAVEQRRPRRSKRGDLRGLPEDWRERIVARMPNYKLAALAQAVTGCRPDELTAGVRLEIQGSKLVATITGSKVTAKTGQPWRRLFWPVESESPLVRALVAAVLAGASIAKIINARAYSGAMRAAGAREWPRRKATVTPYCLRHALAADMKASGMNAVEISAGLGHCCDATKQYYGSASQGGGARSVAPSRVEAAREVKITSKSKYILPNIQNRHTIA
jgi:integrase